ncbi:YaiO family outer membrane beta-barrel protein [Salmonella enterica]|nr:YaiO family outer membrane beta-barrel protein [Salmonella enterica]EEP2474300.1 YaiO family outer membrane beta-barrel protein [Salmonella enterica]EFO7038592.1 YaiO family outer membrane beta-barrel protein [Salmonella enterica]ELO9060114.1 YaiO family outer membrane beta-barrel protein [Salmonella enterica]
MKKTLLLAILSAVTPVHSMSLDELALGYDYTDYSGGYGKRNVSQMGIKSLFNQGAMVASLAQGYRDYGHGDSFHGSHGKTTVWYDWNSVLSTRTGLSMGDNSPVFVRREIFSDFNLKPVKGAVLTLGGRHAQYYAGAEVNGWSVGGSLYHGPLILNYRYTGYNTSGVGSSYSHLVSARLKDRSGRGYTQLYVGTGTGAYTYDWSPVVKNGKLHSISLKRSQPLTDKISLDLVLAKQWFDTPVGSYNGINGQLGVVWAW